MIARVVSITSRERHVRRMRWVVSVARGVRARKACQEFWKPVWRAVEIGAIHLCIWVTWRRYSMGRMGRRRRRQVRKMGRAKVQRSSARRMSRTMAQGLSGDIVLTATFEGTCWGRHFRRRIHATR